jgi:hypothetical protein
VSASRMVDYPVLGNVRPLKIGSCRSNLSTNIGACRDRSVGQGSLEATDRSALKLVAPRRTNGSPPTFRNMGRPMESGERCKLASFGLTFRTPRPNRRPANRGHTGAR